MRVLGTVGSARVERSSPGRYDKHKVEPRTIERNVYRGGPSSTASDRCVDSEHDRLILI